MDEKMIILEYQPKGCNFHYNFLDHISGRIDTNGYLAISLCPLSLASDFCNNHAGDYVTERPSFEEMCRRWDRFCEQNYNKFREHGMR